MDTPRQGFRRAAVASWALVGVGIAGVGGASALAYADTVKPAQATDACRCHGRSTGVCRPGTAGVDPTPIEPPPSAPESTTTTEAPPPPTGPRPPRRPSPNHPGYTPRYTPDYTPAPTVEQAPDPVPQRRPRPAHDDFPRPSSAALRRR